MAGGILNQLSQADDRQIAEKYFPGRPQSSIKASYNKRMKSWVDTFTAEEVLLTDLTINLQIKTLKGLIEEQKKKFWSEIGGRMGKTGVGCERAAKRENISVFNS